MRLKKDSLKKLILPLIFLISSNCSDSSESTGNNSVVTLEEENNSFKAIELNLRVHLMQDISMIHPTGLIMENWVTPNHVQETILPELNAIWSQAAIIWNIESIVQENVVKKSSYQESLSYIVNAERDSNGNSDPERLPHLFSLMQTIHQSTSLEIGKNLFHIYLFPFIGNTSQGNAMSSYNYHSVVGTWTNKHNNGGTPEKTLLTENQNNFKRGSLSRTIAHEIGHVLNLSHNECTNNCLMSGTNSDGYLLNEGQIIPARIEALARSFD